LDDISNWPLFYESNNNNYEDYSYFQYDLRDMLCYCEMECRIDILIQEVVKVVMEIKVVVVKAVVEEKEVMMVVVTVYKRKHDTDKKNGNNEELVDVFAHL